MATRNDTLPPDDRLGGLHRFLPHVVLVAAARYGGGDEVAEERVRAVRAALQFRVELGAEHERVTA